MDITTKVEQEDVTWEAGDAGNAEPTYPEPIYVEMPNSLMDDQVEIQEVVIVTEGNEQTVDGEEIPFTPNIEVPGLQEIEAYEYSHSQPSTSGMQFYFNQPYRRRGRPKLFRTPPPMMDMTPPKYRKMESSDVMQPLDHMAEEASDSESDVDQDTSGLSHDLAMLHNRSLSRKKPKPREFAHRLQWRNRDMLEAMKAVEEQKMTIRGAAKRFLVPYSTLKDRVHGRVRHGTKPGVKTILSPEEEEELVRFIREMENAGFQLRCVDVRDRAAELLRLNHGHNSPYKEGSPGHNWFHGFVKRHPGLEFKRTLKKNIVPSISKQKHMLRRFYDITAGVYKKYKLSHKADRIFSVAELRLGGQFQCTILYAASAAGQMIPPFVVFRGLSMKLTAARSEFPDAFFTCSPDGLINEDIFLWWFRDHFLKKIPSSHMRPGVLFVSRGVQDLTMQLLQIAKDDRMNLIGMPFGISHLVQPLDEDVTDGILRASFDKKFQKWTEENQGVPMSQKIVATILRKVWSKVQAEEIASKFTANGIHPLNAYAITQDKLLTGAHVLREIVEQGGPDRRDLPSSSNQNLSGLNLLSALSSHAYASLDYYNPHESLASNDQSNDSGSEVSTNEIPPDPHASGVDYKFFKSEPNHTTIVPMSEVEEEVQEQVEIACDPSEVEIVTESTEDQPEHLYELQRELSRKRPRPKSEIVVRQSDVQTEINEAKNNVEQINKAIDSILEDDKDLIQPLVQQNFTETAKVRRRPATSVTVSGAPQVITIKSGRTSSAPSEPVQPRTSTPARVIRIAPEQIKQELSRALKNVSSESSPCTLKLADGAGKDIKIHVRIREEEGQNSNPLQRPHSPPGRFIRLEGPAQDGTSRQNVVIQQSQIRHSTPRSFSTMNVPSSATPSPHTPKVITLHGANANGMDYTYPTEGSEGQIMKEVMTPHGPVMVIEPSGNNGETVVDGVVSSDGIGGEIVTSDEQVYHPAPGEDLQDCVIQYVDDMGQVVEEEIVATTS